MNYKKQVNERILEKLLKTIPQLVPTHLRIDIKRYGISGRMREDNHKSKIKLNIGSYDEITNGRKTKAILCVSTFSYSKLNSHFKLQDSSTCAISQHSREPFLSFPTTPEEMSKIIKNWKVRNFGRRFLISISKIILPLAL